MIPYLCKASTLLHLNLSGYDNQREFPSGLKARRASIKMATILSVAIFNHRYKGNRRSFPYFKNRQSLLFCDNTDPLKSKYKTYLLLFFYITWVNFRWE